MINVDSRAARDTLINEIAKSLSPDQVKKATARAINHTLGVIKTSVNKEIRSVYNLSASDVRENLTIQKATNGNLKGFIKANRAPISFSKFNPVSISKSGNGFIRGAISGKNKGFAFKKTRSPNVGVSVQVLKGERKNVPSAFMLLQGSGKGSVMARGNYSTGSPFKFDKPRLPIEGLNSISIHGATLHSKVTSIIMPMGSDRYTERLIHELRYISYGSM